MRDGPHDAASRREFLIAEIYKTALGAAPSSGVLGELADLTRSDRAIWSVIDLRTQTGDIIDVFNVERQFVETRGAAFMAQNPWTRRSQYFQSEGLIWRGSRIVPMQQLVATPYYVNFLAPQCIHHTLHIVLAVEEQRVAHVLLTRRPLDPDYGESEIEIARHFALHARKASECRRSVYRLRMVQSVLSGIADAAAVGIAIVEPPRTIFVSETFRKLTGYHDPHNATQGEFLATENEDRFAPVHFPRVLADAVQRHDYSSTTRLIIDRANGHGRLLARVKPFQFNGMPRVERRRGLAIILYDLDEPVLVDEGLLQTVYDLTASEARVCALLANGECVEDLSERLNISPNTARTHIKRIFGKTGSTRQAELVKLVINTARLRSHAGGGPTNWAEGPRHVGAPAPMKLANKQ